MNSGPEKPNVAVVVLDTVRRDYFEEHFDWLPGEMYLNAYSTSSWTVPAHASLFTGKYPSEVNTHAKSLSLDYSGRTIAEEYQSVGYTTKGLSANPNLCDSLGFTKGFDEVDLLAPIRNNGEVETGVSISNEKISYMGGSSPKFLFLNLMEAHQPHILPDAKRENRFKGTVELVGPVSPSSFEPSEFIDRYAECCAYLSRKYSELYEEISGIFDVIITLTDHGEMLGESQMWGHQYGIHPELVRIGINVWVEDSYFSPPFESGDLINLIDLHRYIASIIDASPCNEEPRQLRFIESGGITSRYVSKLRDANVSRELIDTLDSLLFGVVDENSYLFETHNGRSLAGSDSERDLHEALTEYRSDTTFTVDEEQNELDEEVKERLSDIGYL